MTGQEIGILLIGLGIFVLLLALFAPKYLAQIPGNRWFWGAGPRAGRLGFAAGGSGCVIFGLMALGAIPRQAVGVVLVVWLALAAAACLYELSTYPEPSRPTRPASEKKTSGSKHWRRRKRGS